MLEEYAFADRVKMIEQRIGQETASLTVIDSREKDRQIEVSGRCVITRKYWSAWYPIDGVERWLFGRQLVQDAMPDVDEDRREFLVSAVSPDGWTDLLGEEE